MAGAGGLFVLMAGALVGIVSGLLGAALLWRGSRALGDKARRALTILCVSGSVLAQLIMTPVWGTLVSGKDTRGEPTSWSDFPLFVYVLLLIPPVTLAALGWRRVRARVRDRSPGGAP